MSIYVPDNKFADTFISDGPSNFHNQIYISENYLTIGSPLYCINRAGITHAVPHLFRVKRKANFKCCHIFCITQGSGTLVVEGHEYELKKDMVVVLSSVPPHEYWSDCDDPLGVTWLEFYGSDSNQIVSELIKLHGHVFCGDIFFDVGKKISSLVKEAENHTNAMCSLRIYEILMALYSDAQATKFENEDLALFSKFIPLSQYVDSHLQDKLTIELLASIVGYSGPYFSKLFKQVFEISPYEFILQRRITAAKHLLSTSSMPVSDISALVGFFDTSHFTKRFKQYESISPSEYRTTCPKQHDEYRYPDWWYIADHTTGMETGRMIVVNGGNPGAVFFKQDIAVKPNTYYALTMWITNMNNPTRLPPLSQPMMGITVYAPDGTIVYKQDLKQLPPRNPPQWTQIGGFAHNTNYSTLTVELSTENPDPAGNDYAIDDIVLKEVKVTDLLSVVKTATPCPITVGETITYSVVVTNTSTSTVKNVFFKDPLASNVAFKGGSVTIDTGSFPSYSPLSGFPLGNMLPGSSHTITYKVSVVNDSINPIPNQATATYDFFTSQSGDVFQYTVYSNMNLVNVTKCNLRQSATDVIESIALQQTAIAALIDAEGKKLQKAVQLDLSVDEIIKIQKSIENMTNTITLFEQILHSKAEFIKPQMSC